MKIYISKKPERTKEAHKKVKSLILDMEEDKKGVKISAKTTLREISGRPPMQLINANLDEALKDLYTLEHLHEGGQSAI